MSDFDVFERLLTARRSCRGFRDEQVPRADIEQLLRAAQHTASWCNTQPWQVIVTSGEATTRLADAFMSSDEGYGSDIEFPTDYRGAYSDRRREVGWQLYDAVGVTKGDREASARQGMRNFEFFGAPHLALIHTPAELGTYGVLDCGLYVDSFLLAAQALGLGTCAQAAVAGRSPLLHEWFDIADDRLIVCGIAFGHPDPAHPSAQFMSRRAPIEDAVSFFG